MTMYRRIVDALDAEPQADAEYVAQRVAAEASDDELLEAVRAMVDTVARTRVRLVEQEAMLVRRSAPLPEQFTERLLRQSVALGTHDRTRQEFGRMTVAQHRTRLAMLERIRSGLDQTIWMHREAVSVLERTGATCLDELQPPEPPALAALPA